MFYTFECKNEKCNVKEVTLNISMSEVSKEHNCESCNTVLQRIYSTVGIKTSDGYKS